MAASNKNTIKKNTATNQKAMRKKVSSKKTVTKKPSAKKLAAKKSVGSKMTKKTKVAKGVKKSKSEVVLPRNMSVRTIEKSAVLKREFDEYIRLSMYRIAYASAFCFMAVGAALTVSHFVPQVDPQMQLGQTSGVIDPTYTTNTTSVGTVAIPDPVFKLISPIQDQYLQPDRITFTVSNIDSATAALVQTGVLGGITLPVNSLLNDKYRVDIPVNNLAPGYYKLRIFIKPSNDTKFKLGYQTKEFHVGPYPSTTNISTTQTSTTSTSNTDSTSTDTTSGTSTVVPSTTTAPITTDTVVNNVPFALVLPGDAVISGIETIWVSVPDGYSTDIYLYARPLNSQEKIRVTKAIKRERWVFVIDSENKLPNNKYEFYAETNLDGASVKTKPVTFTVINHNQSVDTTVEPVGTESTLADDEPQERPFIQTREVSTDPTEDFVPTITIEDDVKRETEHLLQDNNDEIENLLKRYAAAVQSGDQILIDAAREELSEKRIAIVTEAMKDKRLQDISDNIDEQLAYRIDNLKKRVDTFEQLRKERSDGATAIDTDGDGISDYDERNLYGTDPEEPDSDNDGFTDGIEIIKGYNPTSDEPEAIIVFESPKESVGLERSDVLVIEEVVRIKDIEGEQTDAPVKAEIRGRGLPNSFVTLFIFSTPTVVTVKTDPDGQFVYTFDKELEDGQHDVYIAMTDNAGEIIAQSSPFSFIKEAEAFTSVDEAEDILTTPEPITEQTKNSYGVVIGIGVLALGLILLMLGISLRSKKDGSEDNIDDDIDGSSTDDTGGVKVTEKPNSRFEHIDVT